MAYFAPFILLFAFAVHLCFVVGQSELPPKTEELPSIDSLYANWTKNNSASWITGMGIIKSHIYLADSNFNLVRAPASQFAVIGEGKSTKAWLGLKGAEVFSFKQHAPLHEGGHSVALETLNKLSVGFVEGDSSGDDSAIKKDSLVFFVGRESNADELPVNVHVVSLDDFNQSVYKGVEAIIDRRHNFNDIGTHSRKILLLSGGTDAALFIQGDRIDNIAFKNAKGPKSKMNITQSLLAQMVDLDQWPDAQFKGGLYLREPRKVVLHTDKHTVVVFKADGQDGIVTVNSKEDVIIPYKDFFSGPPPEILNGARILTILYLVGVVAAFLLLFSLLCYCVCFSGGGKRGKKAMASDSAQSRTPKTGRNAASLASSTKGGGGSSSSGATTSDNSTASKAFSGPGAKSGVAGKQLSLKQKQASLASASASGTAK